MEDLIKKISNELAIRQLSIYKLSQQTGIAKEKLYKWFDPKVQAKPKANDEKVLLAWLDKKEIVPHGTISNKKPRGNPQGNILIDAGSSLIRSEAKLDVLLSAVAELLAHQLQRSVTSVSEELVTAVRSRIDALEQGQQGV